MRHQDRCSGPKQSNGHYAARVKPGRPSDSDIAATRLSVHVGHPTDPVQTPAGQNEPEYLSHLAHDWGEMYADEHRSWEDERK